MNKKYLVRLSEQERQACPEVMKQLKGSSQKVRRGLCRNPYLRRFEA